MNNNNPINTSWIRRFAIGTVAAVAGLGLAGAGSAAAASPTADVAPAVTEADGVENVAYVIGGGSPVLLNDFPAGTVSGGYILDDGTGVIEVEGGTDILITSSFILPFGGGFMQASYGGLDLFGELEMVFPGVYEVELEDFMGFVELELPFLSITPVA